MADRYSNSYTDLSHHPPCWGTIAFTLATQDESAESYPDPNEALTSTIAGAIAKPKPEPPFLRERSTR
ncbi:hypothetical protein AB0757_34930 [Scytonema millei VB511283_2]